MWEQYFNIFYTPSVFYMTPTFGHFSPVAAESAKVCVIIKLSRIDQPYRSDKIKNLYHYITFELQKKYVTGELWVAVFYCIERLALAVFSEDVINSIS